MINYGDGAENIGFVSKEVDLAAVMGQGEELLHFEHINLTGMYGPVPGPVRRTPNPTCRVAQTRSVMHNKHLES